MLRSSRAALAVGLGLLGMVGLVAPSMGQQDSRVRPAANAGTAPAAKPVGPAVIGTLDMDAVLRSYDKFKYQMEQTQAEALNRHNDLMKLATEAKSQSEMLSKLAPGSPDSKKIEERITQLQAQFEAGRTQAQRDFERKDAELLATMYNDIQTMSAAVAKQRNMSFVIKYSATPASGTDPKTVEAALFRSVVYADPAVDVTADVIKWLNYYYKQNGGPAPKGTGPAPTTTPAAGAAPAAATSAAAPAAGAVPR
ncbi:MAG: OmpH family outer membrane protein [Isosphaeraceae bacterium]|nr:OmpH family outer membrane protein [Isosphaeraceae bacterium]